MKQKIERTNDFDVEGKSRETKTKSRRAKMIVLRLFFVIAASCLWWYFCGIRTQKPENGEVSAKPASDNVSPLETYTRLVSYVVKPGDTFLSILSKHGAPAEMAMTFHKALKPLGLSSLFPGDSCVLKMSSTGAMSGFSVLSRLQQWYHISINDSKVHASKTNASITTQRCLVRGLLSSSLSQDLFDLGVGDACVSKFADIFAWDINFFVDPQKGDSFEILFEKKFAEGRFIGYGDVLAATYVNNGHCFNAFGMKSNNGAMEYFDAAGKSLQKEFLKAPLHFNHISSRFSLHRLHPVLGIVRPHLGIDYAAPVGTPVYSAADGKIAFAGYKGGFGNFITVTHGGSFETSYGHLSAFARDIHAGAHVVQGQCIGYVGQTGLATGPHLDYRMTKCGRFVNPQTVVLPSKRNVASEDSVCFCVLKTECNAILSFRFVGELGCFPLDMHVAPQTPLTEVKALDNGSRRRGS